MYLLGIDVGTTGCKTALFDTNGALLASAYREYDIQSPLPGHAELDARAVWDLVQESIRETTAVAPAHAIKALSISSMGEAVVPLSADRRILGPSIMNFDERGAEYLDELRPLLPAEELYAINGNTLGNHYSLTKLLWLQEYQPELVAATDKFLHWAAFVAAMLGADPVVDYSLANRTLLFDLHNEEWSPDLLRAAGVDGRKLPRTVPPGTVVGRVSPSIAAGLGLSTATLIVSGAHDQCANAVGCGVVDAGSAVYGLGTFHCITPVFAAAPDPRLMIARGLNTEHHAIPGRFVSFIYNQSGSIIKWYRDTFAAAEHRQAQSTGRSIYPALFAELDEEPSGVLVLPHFSVTGPPAFIADSAGLITGLHLDTTRGEILKGIIESAAYYLKESIDALPRTGIEIKDFIAAGGGSKSDVLLQTYADIFDIPVTRTAVSEAGALGAAIIAGVAAGLFDSYQTAVAQMVKTERTFYPRPGRHAQFQERYEKYRRLWPLIADYLRDHSA